MCSVFVHILVNDSRDRCRLDRAVRATRRWVWEPAFEQFNIAPDRVAVFSAHITKHVEEFPHNRAVVFVFAHAVFRCDERECWCLREDCIPKGCKLCWCHSYWRPPQLGKVNCWCGKREEVRCNGYDVAREWVKIFLGDEYLLVHPRELVSDLSMCVRARLRKVKSEYIYR